MRSTTVGLGIAAAILVTAGCRGSSDGADVYAASSLTELMRTLGEAYVAEGGEFAIAPRFNFAASSTLATQIREGAPADIFVSANPDLVDALVEEGIILRWAPFATTRMAVAARTDSAIRELSDLAGDGVIVVLAAEGVPAGDYARDVLRSASTAGGLGTNFSERVLNNVRSFEPNVRAALLKVELGEADAAIVYETDLRGRGDAVRTVAIPEEFNVATVSVVGLTQGANEQAEAFFTFLGTPAAATVMEEFGFEPVRSIP